MSFRNLFKTFSDVTSNQPCQDKKGKIDPKGGRRRDLNKRLIIQLNPPLGEGGLKPHFPTFGRFRPLGDAVLSS
jgi:hypothetical protein